MLKSSARNFSRACTKKHPKAVSRHKVRSRKTKRHGKRRARRRH